MKDSEQQVHEKSKSSWAWNATKGKGNTDETLRQSELIAQGELIIKAAEGIRIDVKQVNQQTVSQTIDAMVKADPQLAWLKQAEARGDVDWRRVKEIHDSFKYSNSGLGPAAQLIIAIAMAAIIGPMAAGLGTVGQAVTVSVATQATVSTINNRGNLSAVAKDVTSSDAMKGYVVSAATAGLVQYNPAELGMNWSSVGQIATKTVVDAGIKTAVYGGSFKDNLGDAAVGNAVAIAGAIGADAIGDYVPKGSPQKLVLHAALGGLLAEASGGDFRTGALAAGANEALVDYLGEKLLPQGKDPNSAEYRQGVANLMATSQLIGVLAAVLTDGDAESAAAVAANATQYNYLRHQEVLDMLEEQKKCSTPACRDDVRARYAELDEQRNQELATTCQQDITSCEILSAQLQADAPKIQALADQIRQSGDANTASVIGWLVPGSNQMAQDLITSSIVAQRDGPAASAMATGAQVIASGVGGVKPGQTKGTIGAGTGTVRQLNYEAASYHGKFDNAVKSRAPVNGQEALDSSVQVKPTSPRRVGIDYKTKEFVIFDKTIDTTYHGHVRAWKDLHPDMQKALQKAGLADRKGKIFTKEDDQ